MIAVKTEKLRHVYSPQTPFEKVAVDDFSLEIEEGEFVGVIGHTGSGKSTFIQHLNGLMKPTSGKVFIHGRDMWADPKKIREFRFMVGLVFQYPEYQLFAESVFEDVAFGLKNFREELSAVEVTEAVREALETVGLDYAAIKDRSPFELSGGQKRRVAIAGVIVTKPEILVLDEPAAGLDPLGKEEIMSLLHKIHSDWCKTVIVVSHDMDEIAENCTRAAIFADGQTVAVAEPKELFANEAALYERGLDVPFTAKVTAALARLGITVENDFTVDDFVEQTLLYAKTAGAGMRSTDEGGRNDA